MQAPTLDNHLSNLNSPYENARSKIKDYLNSNVSFTAQLQRETGEQDVNVLINTLAYLHIVKQFSFEKLGEFLRNKDYLPEYLQMKAEREVLRASLNNSQVMFPTDKPTEYDPSLTLPIIKEYLNSHIDFTEKLLQETGETDVDILSLTLAAYAVKEEIAIEKLGAFLKNKDYLPNDYPELKAAREAKTAKENQAPLVSSFTARQ